MSQKWKVPVTFLLVLGAAACSDDDVNDGSSSPPPSSPQGRTVSRTDIVSDQPGASMQDADLVNAWGLAFNPEGPAWVSATETGLSAVYDASGAHVIPSVVIPPCMEPVSSPTGQVFNDTPEAFMGDLFVFVTEEGTIAGWQPDLGGEAALRVSTSDCMEPVQSVAGNEPASYKGVTIAKDESGEPRLYAADFRGGQIAVFDASYAPMELAGRFEDADIPPGFAPFNVQEVEGQLVVTYALQDDEKEDDVSGPGNGFVDLFDIDGELVARLVSGGELDSPWGVAMTPAAFGAMSDRLLIGNFGDGRINVYAPDAAEGLARLEHEGQLETPDGALAIDGLWALRFGLDAGGFRSDVLYFTAGPDDESHGVFGRLEIARQTGTGTPTTPGLYP